MARNVAKISSVSPLQFLQCSAVIRKWDQNHNNVISDDKKETNIAGAYRHFCSGFVYSGFVKACDELVIGPANKEVSNLGKARFGGLKSCGRCCSQNKEKLCHTLIWRIIFLRFKKKSCIMLWYPPKSKLVYNDPREEKETQNRFKMFLILQLMYES